MSLLTLTTEKEIEELAQTVFKNSFNCHQSVILSSQEASLVFTQKLLLAAEGNLKRKAIQLNPLLQSFASNANIINLTFKLGALVGFEIHSYLPLPLGFDFDVFRIILEGMGNENEKLELNLSKGIYYKYNRFNGRILSNIQKTSLISLATFKASLKSLGINSKIFKTLLKILAAILHLGEIEFKAVTIGQTSECTVINKHELETVSNLLSISSENLLHVLIFRTIMFGKERVSVSSNATQSSENALRLAANLYTSLFNWIICIINKRFCSDGVIVRCVSLSTENLPNPFDAFISNISIDYIYSNIYSIHKNKYEDAMEDQAIAHVEFVNPFSDMVSVFFDNTLPKLQKSTQEVSVGKNSAFPGIGCSTFTVSHVGKKVRYETSSFVKDNIDTIEPSILAIFKSNSCSNEFLNEIFQINTEVSKPDCLIAEKFKIGKLVKQLSFILEGLKSSMIWTVFYNQSNNDHYISTPLKALSEYSDRVQFRFKYDEFKLRYGNNGSISSYSHLPAFEFCVQFVQSCKSNGVISFIGKTSVFIDASLFNFLESEIVKSPSIFSESSTIKPSTIRFNIAQVNSNISNISNTPRVEEWVDTTAGVNGKGDWDVSLVSNIRKQCRMFVQQTLINQIAGILWELTEKLRIMQHLQKELAVSVFVGFVVHGV
jgi:hypothetical protein